jgi:hypothetical protein
MRISALLFANRTIKAVNRVGLRREVETAGDELSANRASLDRRDENSGR